MNRRHVCVCDINMNCVQQVICFCCTHVCIVMPAKGGGDLTYGEFSQWSTLLRGPTRTNVRMAFSEFLKEDRTWLKVAAAAEHTCCGV